MLKIIAGERRGMNLVTLDGLDTRPRRGRVRESLFNILQFDIAGRHTLDLFAGSGAVGIEALSRGAPTATFVESASAAAAIIRRNLAKARYEERATVHVAALPGALAHVRPPAGGFGLVFIMPPYHSGLVPPLLADLAARPLLAPNAIVITEIHTDEAVGELPGWKMKDERVYGVTRLAFWARF
ncbi:16S rRNA (guanine(966)-N(2))-methyltransferase RsmD [Candidatus Poribacteria bacterium]|nr:16S rRNA (guanine(966)-N(2))-methyltransferase RsmD [Candidatus Poribacteria bacterium]